MGDPSDRQLMVRVRRGRHDAMEALVARHYGSVVNFAARFLGRPDLAPDMAQEAFAKVVRHIETYDDRASVKTWIFAITANVCRDELRRIKRRREVLEADGPDLHLIGEATADDDETGSPAQTLDRTLKAARVRRAVARLPDAQREAVVLRFFHYLSLKEIAEISRCSIGTIGSRLHYAVKRLAEELAPETGSAGGLNDGLFDSQTASTGSPGR